MRRYLPLALGILYGGVLAVCGACANPYFEQKRSQQRYAQSLRPTQLARSRPAAGQALRTLQLHVYADPDYRAQNLGFRGKVTALVANANEVLAGVFSVELHVEQVDDWDRHCALNDLDSCLAELGDLDPGASDVWVLGMVGSMPQLTHAFDDLGRAQVPGRHMILRGLSDLDEREGVEQLNRVDASDRRDLVLERREHKGTVIFLHEWAHTLGGHHEREPGWILHASYSRDQSAFPPSSVALMRGMLEAQLAKLPAAEQVERYRMLIEQYANGWEPSARADALMRLPVTSGDSTAGSSVVAANHEDPTLAPLSEADRALYAQAVLHGNTSDLAQGLPLALDLAERYPSVYPVQHLACGMAMQRGGNMRWIESVCLPALDLARKQGP